VPNASNPPPDPFPPSHPADLRIDVASRVEYLDLLEELVVNYAAAQGLGPEEAADLGIAARESLTNAIRHGSGLDPGRRVQMELGIGEEGTLVIRVCDEGPGFDPAGVPDPCAPENVTKGCGRGVFLMRRLADGVSFFFPPRGGTVVRLRKGLHPGGARAPRSRRPPG
jgi:serine/threonine-protein kinase RsbW